MYKNKIYKIQTESKSLTEEMVIKVVIHISVMSKALLKSAIRFLEFPTPKTTIVGKIQHARLWYSFFFPILISKPRIQGKLYSSKLEELTYPYLTRRNWPNRSIDPLGPSGNQILVRTIFPLHSNTISSI